MFKIMAGTIGNIKLWDFFMQPDEIDDLLKKMPADFLLNFLFNRACDVIWIYNIDFIQIQYAYINDDRVGYTPEDIKKFGLREKIIPEDRKLIASLTAESIAKANMEKSHIHIPAFSTTHIGSRGQRIPTIVNMLVYYDKSLGSAKYIIAHIKIDYEHRFRELLINMLSKREKEYLKLYVEKMSPKEICRIMDVEPNTVSSYKNSIKTKTGMSSIEEVIEIIFAPPEFPVL